MSDAAPGLRRTLGVRGVWALAINGTIGAGIFAIPATAAEQAGAFSPLLFLLCAALLVPVVLSFAAVASAHRGTGGPALYLRDAFGPFAGFLGGWTFYLTRMSASALNVGVIVAALSAFWPEIDAGVPRVAVLLVLCAAFTWVNVVGTVRAARAIDLLTLAKFLPLLAIVALGLPAAVRGGALETAVTADWPPLGATFTGVMVVIYAYVGWESAVVPGGEVREPARVMPRALLLALLVVTLLYVAVQVVCVDVLPGIERSGARVLVDVGRELLGPFGAGLLTFGVAVSVAGNVASAALSTPRISYALARDGTLPAVLGRVHPRYHTPAVSIVLYGTLTFVLAATGSFTLLLTISVLTRLLIYLAVVVAAVRLRPTAPADALRLPGGHAIPLLAALLCVGLLTRVGGEAWAHTALWLGVGGVLYVAGRRAGAARSAA